METITANQIKKLRTALGLSKAMFAERYGVSSSTVYNWEHGETVPRGDAYRALCADYQRNIIGKSSNGVTRRAAKKPAVEATQGQLPDTFKKVFAQAAVVEAASRSEIPAEGFLNGVAVFGDMCLRAGIDPGEAIEALLTEK